MDKIKVPRRKEDYVGIDHSSLKDIKGLIERFIDLYGEDATLQSYYEHSDDPYWGIYVKELESDAEYAFRVSHIIENEKWERRKYEELKKKFEDT